MYGQCYNGNGQWAMGNGQISKDFIKSSNGHCDKQYFLEVDVQYPEILHDLHDLFCLKEWKLKNLKKTTANLLEKRMSYK